MTSSRDCVLCGYYARQHSSQCCCASCWKSRQPVVHSSHEQSITSAAASRAKPSATAVSSPPTTTPQGCVHTGRPHYCKACVVPQHRRHAACGAALGGVANSGVPLGGQSRLYLCEACPHTQQPKVHEAPLVGCGCRATCPCRRRTGSNRAGKKALLVGTVSFAPNEVPKMGPRASQFMRGDADAQRMRFLF